MDIKRRLVKSINVCYHGSARFGSKAAPGRKSARVNLKCVNLKLS